MAVGEDEGMRSERDWLGWIQLGIVGAIIVASLALTGWLAASSARSSVSPAGTQPAAAPVEIVRPRAAGAQCVLKRPGRCVPGRWSP